jgi:hypothetical protein
MHRTTVESSNLRSVGYDANAKLLEVEFRSGRIYRYSGVDDETHQALMDSESKGGYHFANIRSSFPYEQAEA